jgi:hypothetical protein
VRKLFGIPEVAVQAAQAPTSEPTPTTPSTPTQDEGGMNTLTVASIVTLAVGAGVGIAGVVVGMSAQSTFDDYKQTSVTDRTSAAAADATYNRAQSQATLANVLMPIGGALIVGGVVMLVMGLNDSGHEAGSAQVAFVPSSHGGTVFVSGSL